MQAGLEAAEMLERGRERRLDNLEELLEPLSREELRVLAEASEILDRAVSGRGRAPAA